MTPKHILVPIDLADEPTAVVAPVTELARRLGCRVTLLSVVRNQVYAAEPATAMPVAMDAKEQANALRGRLEAFRKEHLPSDLSVDCATCVHNDIGRGILEHAAKHDADLIAMATHGRSGLSRVLLGSVAESVLRHGKVPLLLYPMAG